MLFKPRVSIAPSTQNMESIQAKAQAFASNGTLFISSMKQIDEGDLDMALSMSSSGKEEEEVKKSRRPIRKQISGEGSRFG